MEKDIKLDNIFYNNVVEYMVDIDDMITSRNTLKSYTNILGRIVDEFDVISQETLPIMLKKYKKKTKIRAVLNKINEYFYYKNIDFNIRLPKNKRTPRNIPDIISKDELINILKKIKDPRYVLFLKCLYNIGAGLRISELINLKWERIDWSSWGDKSPSIDVKIRNSKGSKDRIVPIPSNTLADLYQYASALEILDEDGIPKNGRIFSFDSDNFSKRHPNSTKDDIEFEYIKYAYDKIRYELFNKYFKKIKNKRITSHSIRRSRATELYNVYKIKLEVIQKWLGHDNLATTLLYVQISTKEDKKLIEEVGGI